MKTYTLLSNYTSSAATTGTGQKASSYYNKTNTQTVAFTHNLFVGTATLQGTLEKEPLDADYFAVQTLTAGTSATVPGNFTFLRVKIDAGSTGTITNITLSY
jgi:hypothetical protein